MKPSKGIEQGATAWNRWVRIYKKQPSGQYSDHEIPVRLRGYSELRMGDLTKRERKAIDTSIRRGYSLSESPRWMECLRFIIRSVDWNLGYLGKTRGTLWFPSNEARDDCLQHMEAQLVMTEKFSARDLYTYGDNKLRIQVSGASGYNYDADHLKAHLTELRTVADEHMDAWVTQRVTLADRLLPDDAIVRVPYDTKKELL